MPSLHWLKNGWRGHAMAVLAGAMLPLSLAPYDLWPGGVLGYLLLVWLWSESNPKEAFLRGWWYGAGAFGVGTSWVYVSIHVYGYASVPLAAALTALFCAGMALYPAVAGYCYARFLRDRPFGSTLCFAALMVLTDWFRSWALTGFPWLFAGYGHVEAPLAGWAPIVGVFGITFILALTGGALVRGLTRRSVWPVLAILPFWLAGVLLQQIDWTTPTDNQPVRVALVQANIPQSVKWDPDQYWRTLNRYVRMSQPLWETSDIVVWPEAAIPGYYQRAKPFLDRMNAIATQYDAALITGVPYSDDEGHFYNSVTVVGDGSGLYHKQQLVPFGEYVPLESWLRGLIAFFDLPMSSFSSGSADQPPLQAKNLTLAPFICYEVVYPNLMSSWLPDANTLITISNDAWFGDSIGPLQHLQMAQMRALESGRYMIRSTGNGVTAIIDQRGHITTRLPQFVQDVLSGDVYAMQGTTPIANTGYWPVIGLCAIIVAVLGGVLGFIRR